jgi:DNA-binding transcriptional LysR family regulator
MSTPTVSALHLQCFVLVVDTGSFAEAGRRMGLSTTGVSKNVARLEAARGVRLLNRSTHSLSLTPEGETLIGPSRDAVSAMGLAEAAFAAAARDGTAGRVRMGAPTAFLRACLAPLVPALHAAHPDIVLDLRASDEMVDLAEAGLDIALRTGSLDAVPGHLQQALMSFGWVACASPRYLLGSPSIATPDDLPLHRCIGFRNQRTGFVDPWRFRDAGSGTPMKLVPKPTVVLDDANAAVEAAVAGAGIAWAPDWLVAAAVRSGNLKAVLKDWSPEPMTMFLVRRRNGRDPKRIEQVIAFLKANVEAVRSG